MNDPTPRNRPSQGSLATTPVSELLETLAATQDSGTLALRQDNLVKALFIQNGELVFATSTSKPDRLGEILLRHGVISQSAHQATTAAMRESGKREGETLVELGILAPKALFDGLKLQVEEIIISLLLWDDGSYQFMEGALPSHVVPLPIHLEQLLPKALDRLHPND